MSARITDSLSYAHLWGTPELRSVFEETERMQGWLDVLAALARAQAAEGQIPAEAADERPASKGSTSPGSPRAPARPATRRWG